MRFIAFLLLLPLLGGCLSPARQLDASAVAQIKPGTSTQIEVEQQFGKPQELLVGSNHKTVAEYSLMMDSPPSPNLQRVFCLRTLSVLYDPNYIVEKMIHHESSKTLEWRVTGTSIGSHMKTDWIRKGQTTSNAVITSQGPPDIKTLTPEGEVVLAWIYAKQERGNRLSVGAERFSILVNDQGIVMDFQTRAGSVPTGM